MNQRTIKVNKIFILLAFFSFVIISLKLAYVALSPKVDGKDLKAFAAARNTSKKTLYATRGNIYTHDGEILAKNVNSYTVIAYLDPDRTTDKNHPNHVVDKEATAKALSPLINMTPEKILSLLNLNEDMYLYQVELGPGGCGITELVKEQIKNLELPGIDFVSSTKRYYPNGDFLSYSLGYAKTLEDDEIVGELGLELYYNDELTGTNGYKEYQQDIYGYEIANTPSITKEAVSGSDIYLTIDTNIQMFTEQAVAKLEEGLPEWATVGVMEAKTGKILGVASTPSFNPNEKNIVSYYDPFVSYVYEPGSVMKIFSFMAALENGVYNGSETYISGSLEIDDATIKDWNRYGWGTITYDEGFYASSNVAASNLALKLGREKLMDFYNKLGFGSQTGIKLPSELFGTVAFRYNTELANASFGQGLSVTAIQMMQALTAVANDGVVLKPYIVEKIVNSNNEVTYERKKEELATITSKETIDKIKDLMRGVIDGRSPLSTGGQYNVSGYNVMGKTGTAEIASTDGGYLTGYNDYLRSIAIVFPQDDPQVIIYVVTSKPVYPDTLTTATNGLITDVGTYLNIQKTDNPEDETIYEMESFVNKKTTEVCEKLTTKKIDTVVLGSGDKIIKQYPSKNTMISNKEKVFLVTNSDTYYYPNLLGYSRNDLVNFGNLFNLKYNFSGYGYAVSMSVSPGNMIDISKPIDITLEPKYKVIE